MLSQVHNLCFTFKEVSIVLYISLRFISGNIHVCVNYRVTYSIFCIRIFLCSMVKGYCFFDLRYFCVSCLTTQYYLFSACVLSRIQFLFNINSLVCIKRNQNMFSHMFPNFIFILTIINKFDFLIVSILYTSTYL